MVRRRSEKAAEHEAQIQIALQGLADGTYMSTDHAVTSLGVSKTTLIRRLKGGKSRQEGRETFQLLTPQEEKALADWISNATAAGNPINQQYIKELADEMRRSRVDHSDVQEQFLRPIGITWVPAFLKHHPHLQTKLSRSIEWTRISDVTREQVIKFNEDFRHLIHEKKVKLENIYNSDETGIKALFCILIIGSSIGTCQGTNVVVDTSVKHAYAAQPGRQEWVTVIECISASGSKIPPYVIFKGEHLVSIWLPATPPPG